MCNPWHFCFMCPRYSSDWNILTSCQNGPTKVRSKKEPEMSPLKTLIYTTTPRLHLLRSDIKLWDSAAFIKIARCESIRVQV